MIRIALIAAASFLFAGSALAADREAALEALYVAADVLDKAEGALAAGNAADGQRFLVQAYGHLETARKLDPSLHRTAFERARLFLLRNDPRQGEAVLLPVMRGDLPITDRVRGVELLDSLRIMQDRPTLGDEWEAATGMRDAGAMLLGIGASTFVAGLAVAFDSYVRGAAAKIDDDAIAINRFGWVLTGVGGGIALGGTGLVVAGSVRIGALRPILPGPWHLPNAPDGVTLSMTGTTFDPSAVALARTRRARR
jgi:hypothetical protein